MLFYSYAELVVGLIAVFYFTSKIFAAIASKAPKIIPIPPIAITGKIISDITTTSFF